VSERRLRALIASEHLHATRVGNQWAVDESALARYSPRFGRPLSARSAWGLLDLAAGRAPDLSPSERSRARRRLKELVEHPEPEALLRSWLPLRARRLVYRVSPRDVSELRQDARLRLSGISHPRSEISAADAVEGYIHARDVADLVRDYLLIESEDGQGNVIMHVPAGREPDAVPVETSLALAADLTEHRSSREDGRAAELVRELA
jgi:hypothetical protein